VLAQFLTPQLVFNGCVNGLLIGLLSLAMVLVYRSTRVINFAVGNIGLVGATLLPLLVLDYEFPYWVGLAICLACGTSFATVSELIVVRRLFHAPRVIVLVATVGIAQLAAGVASAYPELDATGSNYPRPSTRVFEDVAGLRITGVQLAVLMAVAVVVGCLLWLLDRTTFGRTVEAASANPSLARLSGVNPKLVSTFVWTAAGLVSTVAMIALSTLGGAVGGLDNLGPVTLSRAMIAFVLAGMRSYRLAVVYGALIGVVEAIVRFNFIRSPGLFDLLGFTLVLGVVFAQHRTRTDDGVFAFAPKVRARPERVNEVVWLRYAPIWLGALVAAAVIAVPLMVTLPSRQLVYTSIACFAICAISLSVITGWAGQLSLAQMTFAGFGALLSAAFVRGLALDVGLFDLDAPALPFLVAIPLAALIVAGMAVVVGLGALRVRGLQLAVVTFVFAVAAEQYIYRLTVFSDGNANSVSFRRGTLFGLSLTDNRTYYYFCVAVLAVVFLLVTRLRRSGIGRTTIAARDNPDAAAAYTVSPTRTKLTAFALAGGLAAVGGALLAGLLQTVPFGEQYFLESDSLQLVGMVVVGGIASRTGPILGALWVIGLPAFFKGNELVPLFTSSIGLLLVVMYFPGGLAQIGRLIRDAVDDWAVGRLPTREDQPRPRPPIAAISVSPRGEAAVVTSGAALRADGVTVRFGGNVAVDGAGIEVARGELVGLIGTNGAGKSTLLNAIGGYVPASGSIELFGEDISHLGITQRARRGLGRTFQTATLFPELSVRETLQVALEARGRTRFFAAAAGLPSARWQERARRSEADELLSFVGLGRYADFYVADLSTGTRRIVELANLLALDAKVLCLDEPTAGLAQRETEAFGPLLLSVRREMQASMVVIEHDMPLIMSISDRVYCLELGKVIAQGAPEQIRNDTKVVASYLSTDARAIARSNAGALQRSGDASPTAP
jgi:ABC-type branched-subunit amino acid transport system ATPase component/branched-subunit amino acid ABC-type transport system permease component